MCECNRYLVGRNQHFIFTKCEMNNTTITVAFALNAFDSFDFNLDLITMRVIFDRFIASMHDKKENRWFY